MKLVYSTLILLIFGITRIKCMTIMLHYSINEQTSINFLIGNIYHHPNFTNIFKDTQNPQMKLSKKLSNKYVDLLGNGELRVKSIIDREVLCNQLRNCYINLLFMMKQVKSGAKVFFEVKITIIDINDNKPRWFKDKIVINIPEHVKINRKYRLPLANDRDASENNTHIEYKLNSDTQNPFTLVYDVPRRTFQSRRRMMSSLWLKVIGVLDREILDQYKFRLLAIDAGNPPQTGSVLLTIQVTDINDHAPVIIKHPRKLQIKENNKIGEIIYQMKATDEDLVSNQSLHWSFSYSIGLTEQQLFKINSKTGEISILKQLDYENDQGNEFILPIQVSDMRNDDGQQFNDGNGEGKVTETMITIQLININDNKPSITMLSHVPVDRMNRLIVSEDGPVGLTLATLAVSDADNQSSQIECGVVNKRMTNQPRWSPNSYSQQRWQNNELDSYELKEKPKVQLARVVADRGRISKFTLSLNDLLDREIKPIVDIKVICKDDGYPRLTATSIIFINISDINDCTPKFTKSHFKTMILENSPPNTHLINMSAIDCDIGVNAQLHYSFITPDNNNLIGYNSHDNGVFRINSATGNIYTLKSLDREKLDHYRLIIKVQDMNGDVKNQSITRYGVLSSSATLDVIVADLNDCAPSFDKDHYYFSTPEGDSGRVYVGNVVANDCDGERRNKMLRYKMVSQIDADRRFLSRNYFSVDGNGEIYTRRKPIDREQIPKVTFKVSVTDGKHTRRTTVTVKILDINDNRPKWLYSPIVLNISRQLTIGSVVANLEATDSDEEMNGMVEYSILRGNLNNQFTINPSSGLLQLNKPLPSESFTNYQLNRNRDQPSRLPLDNPNNRNQHVIPGPVFKLVLKAADNGNPSLSNSTEVLIYLHNGMDGRNGNGGNSKGSYFFFGSGQYLEKDLIVMICMITVTMVVSGILVVAIVLLKCKGLCCNCYANRNPDNHGDNPNSTFKYSYSETNNTHLPYSPTKYDSYRSGNPDGHSSPTASDMLEHASLTKVHQCQTLSPSGSSNTHLGYTHDMGHSSATISNSYPMTMSPQIVASPNAGLRDRLLSHNNLGGGTAITGNSLGGIITEIDLLTAAMNQQQQQQSNQQPVYLVHPASSGATSVMNNESAPFYHHYHTLRPSISLQYDPQDNSACIYPAMNVSNNTSTSPVHNIVNADPYYQHNSVHYRTYSKSSNGNLSQNILANLSYPQQQHVNKTPGMIQSSLPTVTTVTPVNNTSTFTNHDNNNQINHPRIDPLITNNLLVTNGNMNSTTPVTVKWANLPPSANQTSFNSHSGNCNSTSNNATSTTGPTTDTYEEFCTLGADNPVNQITTFTIINPHNLNDSTTLTKSTISPNITNSPNNNPSSQSPPKLCQSKSKEQMTSFV